MARLGRRKKFLFALVTLGVAVLCCELGARAVFAFLVGPRVLLYGTGAYHNEVSRFPSVVMVEVGHTPPTPEGYKPWNPKGAYTKFAPHEHKTDHDENGERFHPTINERGFRGPEFSVEKPAGIVRVVTLGASSTFGYHDRDDETYPHYMEQLLNEAGGGRSFEVINLGMPHMTSEQILSIFLQEALPLAPDVVTFYEGWNDATLRPDDLDPQAWRQAYAAIQERSLIVALADSLFYYAGKSALSPARIEEIIAVRSERYLAHLSAIYEECRKRGILFVVATQQACSELVGREQRLGLSFADEVQLVREELASGQGLDRRAGSFLVHDGIMAELERWGRGNGVPLADVIAATDERRDVLLTYVHPNAEGNRMIARGFVEEILRHR